MITDQIEYSVCEDCLLCLAHGVSDTAPDEHDQAFDVGVKRELGDSKGHFVTGIEPTEEDEEGSGYEEFSPSECELCRSTLAGARHGATLLIEGDDDES